MNRAINLLKTSQGQNILKKKKEKDKEERRKSMNETDRETEINREESLCTIGEKKKVSNEKTGNKHSPFLHWKNFASPQGTVFSRIGVSWPWC